jgi:hypothetical protein
MSAPVNQRPNPYIGPRSFRRDDKHLFYGRDRELQKLLNLLIAERIVLLHSPSGAGKTSLINAALIPELEREKFRVLPVMRVNKVLPPAAPEGITVANRYTFSALLSLEEKFPKELRVPLEKLGRMTFADYLQDAAQRQELLDFQARLRIREVLRKLGVGERNSSLAEMIGDRTRMLSLVGDLGAELMQGMNSSEADALLKMSDDEVLSQVKADRESAPIVLIFDQFEEVLTIDSTDHPDKLKFFKQVGTVLYNDLVWAVFSMREDHVASLQPYLRPLPTRLGTRFRLSLLTVKLALEAINKPAREEKVVFKEGVAEKLVDDLRTVRVQSYTGATKDEQGDYVEPMQLQVVCYRLWQQLQFSDDGENKEIISDHLKGSEVNQALTGFYEDCLQQVVQSTATRETDVRRWVRDELITSGETRGSVYMGPDGAGGMSKETVEKLQELYLLRSEYRAGARWYELTHDRFIKPIVESNRAWLSAYLLRKRVTRVRTIAAIWFVFIAVLWLAGLESITPSTIQQIKERESKKALIAELEAALTLYNKKAPQDILNFKAAADRLTERLPYLKRNKRKKGAGIYDDLRHTYEAKVTRLYRKNTAQGESLRSQFEREGLFGGLGIMTRRTVMFLPIICNFLLLAFMAYLTLDRVAIVAIAKELFKGSHETEDKNADNSDRTSFWSKTVLPAGPGTDNPHSIRDALGWNLAHISPDKFTLVSLAVIVLMQLRIAWLGTNVLTQLEGSKLLSGLPFLGIVLTAYCLSHYLRTGLQQQHASKGVLR